MPVRRLLTRRLRTTVVCVCVCVAVSWFTLSRAANKPFDTSDKCVSQLDANVSPHLWPLVRTQSDASHKAQHLHTNARAEQAQSLASSRRRRRAQMSLGRARALMVLRNRSLGATGARLHKTGAPVALVWIWAAAQLAGPSPMRPPCSRRWGFAGAACGASCEIARRARACGTAINHTQAAAQSVAQIERGRRRRRQAARCTSEERRHSERESRSPRSARDLSARSLNRWADARTRRRRAVDTQVFRGRRRAAWRESGCACGRAIVCANASKVHGCRPQVVGLCVCVCVLVCEQQRNLRASE